MTTQTAPPQAAPEQAEQAAAPCPAAAAVAELIDRLAVRARVHAPLRLVSPWGVDVPAGQTRFYAVSRGGCVIETDDAPEPIPLGEAELVVVDGRQPHRLRDAPTSAVTPVGDLLAADPAHVMRLVPGGGISGTGSGTGDAPSTELIWGTVSLESPGESIWSTLPPVLRAGSPDGVGAAWARYTLRLIAHEARSDAPGTRAVLDLLAQALVVRAIHAALEAVGDTDAHRLRAAVDADLSPALSVIHARPEHPWTVAALAQTAAMSRSAFAARFTAVAGEPPLQYLTRFRMERAKTLLHDGRCPIKQIAPQVGYESEAAFSNAFKRWTGVAPGAYRRRSRAGAAMQQVAQPA